MNNNQIPKFAYIEAQVLHQAANQGLLAPIARLVETQRGYPSGSCQGGTYPETRILSLLYLLIVVPKEFKSLHETHKIYEQIEKSWSPEMVDIELEINPFKNAIYSFIYHLRNAIAHTRFAFKDGYFEFWDKKNKDSPINYKAKLPIAAISPFLEAVGTILANYEEEIK
jgi:hypothetical protein